MPYTFCGMTLFIIAKQDYIWHFRMVSLNVGYLAAFEEGLGDTLF